MLRNGCDGDNGFSSAKDEPMTSSDDVTYIEREEMLSNENSTLRDRVAELERKLQEQEDELILLRSSMADVLRRLSLLEQEPCNTADSRMAKYLSKSSSNIRIMTAQSPESSTKFRRPPSPSLKRPVVGSMLSLAVHNGTNGQMHSTPKRPATPSSPSTSSIASAAVRSSSTCSTRRLDTTDCAVSDSSSHIFSRSPALVSPNGKHIRDPVFLQEDNCLRIFLRGKPVNLYAPSSVHSVDVYQIQNAPKEKLKLEWVYGYRGRDCRSNIHALPTGELVYFIAMVVVLYNVEEQTQRHYTGHTDEVRCIAIHPNRLIVASGQAAKHGGLKLRVRNEVCVSERLHDCCDELAFLIDNMLTKQNNRGEMESLLEEGENLAHIRVWDSVSLQTLHILGVGDFERSVCCMSFSKTDNGTILCAVDESCDHMLSLWDWQKKRKIVETKSANEQMFACEFHPVHKNAIVVCGKTQISFWTFDGVTLQRKPGLFEGRDKAPKYMLCLAFTENGFVLSGDSNGTIIMWNQASKTLFVNVISVRYRQVWQATGKMVKQVPKVHEGGVFCLCAVNAGRFVSGGKDGKLLEWDSELKPLSKAVSLPERVGPIRTVTAGKGGMIIVGTTHNCILQGTMQLPFSIIMQGHSDDVHGFSAHPTQPQFLTVGYDKLVKLWDSLSKSVVWTKEIADPGRSVSFHPSGLIFAIGSTVGRWLIIDACTKEVVFASKDGSDMITCIDYSPDGSYLAVGSHDGSVFIHEVSDNGRRYNRIGHCGNNANAIKHLDWSMESDFIRTNSSNLEICYWHTATCKQVAVMDDVRDILWATNRCTLSYNTAGLWSENSDGTDVIACCSNNRASLTVSACSNGELKLYQYPCNLPKAQSNCTTGHSHQVADVGFLIGDCRVVSAGGKDHAVFQWEVTS